MSSGTVAPFSYTAPNTGSSTSSSEIAVPTQNGDMNGRTVVPARQEPELISGLAKIYGIIGKTLEATGKTGLALWFKQRVIPKVVDEFTTATPNVESLRRLLCRLFANTESEYTCFMDKEQFSALEDAQVKARESMSTEERRKAVLAMVANATGPIKAMFESPQMWGVTAITALDLGLERCMGNSLVSCAARATFTAWLLSQLALGELCALTGFGICRFVLSMYNPIP